MVSLNDTQGRTRDVGKYEFACVALPIIVGAAKETLIRTTGSKHYDLTRGRITLEGEELIRHAVTDALFSFFREDEDQALARAAAAEIVHNYKEL